MNILFADDEPLVFSIFKHHLAKYKDPYIKPYFVKGGEELVNKFKELSPTVVFTDICMPGINGLEAIDEIKQEYGESASFYVFSGYDEFEYARHAIRSNVKDYISKPVSYPVFAKIIEKEEKLHFSGLSLDLARSLADEEEALRLSKLVSELAMAFISNHSSWLEECSEKWKEECFPIEESFFLLHFGQPAKELEEQERIIKEKLLGLKINGDSSSKSTEIIRYIDKNYSDPSLSLDKISLEFGYSLQYLSSYLKKETEVGFSEYVTNKRIDKAKLLLTNTDKTVSEIASECGYSYSNYFIKVFSKRVGTTPQEWKRKEEKKGLL